MAAIFLIFAESLTTLFIADPAVIYWGTFCVMLAAFEQPTIAATYVLAGALRGSGDTRWPMYVTILGVWVFRMPLVYLFVEILGWSIISVWVLTSIDFLVRSLVLWRRFRTGAWRNFY
jgi:Na+-driven multidrug efflux pump